MLPINTLIYFVIKPVSIIAICGPHKKPHGKSVE